MCANNNAAKRYITAFFSSARVFATESRPRTIDSDVLIFDNGIYPSKKKKNHRRPRVVFKKALFREHPVQQQPKVQLILRPGTE